MSGARFPRNPLSAFAVMFLVSAAVVPLQNLAVWGPEWSLWFYASPELTAEKVSVGVAGLGLLMLYAASRPGRAGP